MKSLVTSSKEPDSLRFSALSPLPLAFYSRPSVEVARELLGKGLWTSFGRRPCLVEIVEVEAYLGAEDPASHAFRGPNARNGSMFRAGGICYVYLSYGINFCMNVVTGSEGTAQAVLLRAGAPILGEKAMRLRRKIPLPLSSQKLLDGPGKLTQALGIDLRHDGMSLSLPQLRLVDLGKHYASEAIEAGPRIGISKAVEAPLRFVVKGSPWLSRRSRR